MLFKVLAYLKFLKKSTNEHGVHSPFVYDLITKCFYVKGSKEHENKYKSYIEFFYQNESEIEVEDFGAGSKVFKSNNRKVSKMAKVAAVKKKNALLLMRLMSYLKPKNILELGTSLGVGTSCMAFSNPDANITTLEGCKNTAHLANTAFQKYNLENIELRVGEFSKTLPLVLDENKYDFIYFDGNHSKEATINYFNQALESIHNDSLFVFDDIHWSLEMEEAWEEIKKNKQVKVTIDTFQWGFVFFRKEQVKEHFIIRL